MKEKVTIKEDDWIRFYQRGALVIGVVQYVKDRPLGGNSYMVYTEIGAVNSESVIEIRRLAEAITP